LQAKLQLSLADRRRLQAHKIEGDKGGEDGKANSAYSNTAGSAGFGQGTISNPAIEGPVNEKDYLNIEAKEDLEDNGQDSNGGYKNRRMAKKKKVQASQE
jgi:hypothetical protein